LKAGGACQIFNRDGFGAEALIEEVSWSGGARLRLRNIFPLRKSPLFLKVAQALPQKKKIDGLVEKAEELGVQELWILETKRTIVKMSQEACQRARRRWERIVIEAAKQSSSPILMRVEGPFSFEAVIEEKLGSRDQAFLFHPDPEGLAFFDFVQGLRHSQIQESPSPLFLFFGPEGGFTEGEVRLAESRGVRKVFLGPSTLRLETAFLGVVSSIRFLI